MIVPMGTRYTFGVSEFDSRRGVLTVAGEARALRPRTATVLEAFLKRAGGLVTRDELMRLAWPGLVVTANSVEQCVSELRRGLDGARGAALRTVPRRGYVLDAQVRSAEGSPVSVNGSRTLGVLPLSGDGAAARRLAGSLTRDLASAIACTPCVHVVSVSTAASCAGAERDVRRIGRELAVDYVVEGEVTREGSAWRIALKAFETLQAREVWAERFEPSGRMPAGELRDYVARRAAALLAADLSATEARAAPDARPRDAREMTKRAYFLWLRDLPVLSHEAVTLAREACALDVGAAGPWAMIAYWHLSAITLRAAGFRQAAGEAERAARHALSLDPVHRLAYGALGSALAYGGRFDEAFAALERQLSLNPAPGAHHLLGRLQVWRGKPRLAVEALSRALALAPVDSRRSAFLETLALAHLHLGQDRKAMEIARQAVAQPRPWPRAYETLAIALALNRQSAEARAAISAVAERWPGYSIARHLAELPSREPVFLGRHARLVSALARAGLPKG